MTSGSSVRARIVGLAAGAALIASLVPAATALATNLSDFTVTPSTGGANIPASTAGGAWTSLTGPVINVTPYSNPDVIPANALVFQLQLPANFEWNTARTAAPTVAIAPNSPAGTCALVATSITYWSTPSQNPVYSYAQFGLSGSHDVGCTITLAGLQVRPVSGSASADTGGNIAVTWTLSGAQSTAQNGGPVTMAASAPPVITPATGGTNIPASTAGGAWTTLSGPTITEGTAGSLSAAQIVLALPTNFVFNPNVTAEPSSNCGYPVSAITYFGAGNQATSAQVTVSGHATMSVCSIGFGQLLQVRPISSDAANGTGGNITVSVNGTAVGNGGAVTMAAASGPLNLTAYSPYFNNNAIFWGQYVDLTTTGASGTVFQLQASTDQKTWTPIKDSSGNVYNFTIGSGGSSTFRYTPVRNYWYRSVAGSTISASQPRVPVRQTFQVRPSNSGATYAVGSTASFTTYTRPTGTALPQGRTTFWAYKKVNGAWSLVTTYDKTPNQTNGETYITWTWPSSGSWFLEFMAQPTSVNANSLEIKQYYTVK